MSGKMSAKSELSARILDGIVVATALLLTLFFVSRIPIVAEHGPVRYAAEWIPSLEVRLSFVLDGLSLLFALIISGAGTFVSLYAGAYLAGHEQLGRFRLYLLLFMLSMLGLVLADNLVGLFVFWELTTVTSYLLIGFDHQSEAGRRSARQALLVTGGGGLAMMAGFVMLGQAAGSWELSEIRRLGDLIRGHELYLPILVTVLCGAFAKSAQFPLHFWLPNAMAAPTPVSAYLHSATMVKGGIYLLARLYPVLGGTMAWSAPLILVGGLTAVWSSLLALRQNDMKLMLAYTTVMALGTLTLLLGTDSTVAVTGMAVFLLVHSLYKCTLFLVVGSIDHECGTRKLDEVGGLSSKMPVTAAAAVLAGLSMAGLPPLFGFVGKELIYQGALEQVFLAVVAVGAALAANILMVAVAGILIVRPFFSPNLPTPRPPHEAPWRMWLGPAVLSGLGLVCGLGAATVGDWLIQPAVRAIVGQPVAVQLGLFHGVNLPLLLSGATVLSGLLLYRFRRSGGAAVGWVERLLPFSGDQAYDYCLKLIYGFSHWQTEWLQHGSLSRYLATVFASIMVGVGGTLLLKGGIVGIPEFPELYFYEWTVLGLIGLGIAVTLRTASRLMAICALGIVGACVGLIYLMYGAPDVALTQLTVEILVVVLITVVILKLPAHATVAASGRLEKLIRAGIAIGTGAVFTLLLLGVNSTPLDLRITDYYAKYSHSLAHGRNIVNVVLVDFRGFDTMGEITVLSVAGLTAYQMIKLRARREKR